MHLPDEPALIAACKRNERADQRAIFDAYADALMTVCCRYLRSAHDAEDAMRAGFTKFFTSIGRFVYSGEGSVRPWLQKIVVNECLMTLRKKPGFVLAAEVAADSTAEPCEDALDALSAKEILALIASLPDGYRTVFNLFIIEGFAHAEIARMLGIAEATSRSQLLKAQMLLQSRIHHSNEAHEATKR